MSSPLWIEIDQIIKTDSTLVSRFSVITTYTLTISYRNNNSRIDGFKSTIQDTDLQSQRGAVLNKSYSVQAKTLGFVTHL